MSAFERVFGTERFLRIADKVVRNEMALLVGVISFFLVRRFGLWDALDPFLNLVVIPFGLATWYEAWRAKHARYAASSVDRDRAAIVSVDVNTDTAASVMAHFGREADVYVRSATEMGKTFLKPEDVTELAKIVFRKCAPFRNRTIYLVLAGPAGLCFQVGQLLAAHKFDVVPLSWARDKYQELPRLGIDDIGA